MRAARRPPPAPRRASPPAVPPPQRARASSSFRSSLLAPLPAHHAAASERLAQEILHLPVGRAQLRLREALDLGPELRVDPQQVGFPLGQLLFPIPDFPTSGSQVYNVPVFTIGCVSRSEH